MQSLFLHENPQVKTLILSIFLMLHLLACSKNATCSMSIEEQEIQTMATQDGSLKLKSYGSWFLYSFTNDFITQKPTSQIPICLGNNG